MKDYTDTNAQAGPYELRLGFFWDDNRIAGPQYMTLTFHLSSEMEEDYPGEEQKEKYGY